MRSRYTAPLHRPFDVVACHGAGFTMSFQREAHVRRLLKHVAATLRPGGLFFGVIPDSSAIWYRAQKSNRSPPSFGGDGYSVTFDVRAPSLLSPPGFSMAGCSVCVFGLL